MDDRKPERGDVLIQVRDVKKIYKLGDEQVFALNGVDVDVYRGEYLSVMGPSGSGKTTLFNMIGALDKPTTGEVRFEGANISTLDQYEIAWLRCRKIGYIFQSFNLIPVMTAIENVKMPLTFAGYSEKECTEKAADKLARVGLGERLLHLPSQLSGGQQQRVAIARALANDSSVLLADEPTGNLDLNTGREIIDLLKALQNEYGATIITNTHDLKMIGESNRIVWLRDGKIAKIQRREEIEVDTGSEEAFAATMLDKEEKS